MRLDSRLLGWGVFLIALGAVPLVVAQGYATREAAAGLWNLWPLLLVGAGVSVLLRRTVVGDVIGVLVAGTLGVMVGGLVVGGIGGAALSACGDDAQARPFPAATGEGREGTRFEVEFDCGDLTVSVGDGATWTVEGTAHEGDPPEVDASGDAVRVTTRDDDAGFGLFRSKDRWSVTLPDVPIDLGVSVNAGQATLDLADARIPEVRVSANASEVTVDLEEAAEIDRLRVELNAGSAAVLLPSADLEGEVSVNAGSIELCAPDDVGLRLRSDGNITGTNNFDQAGLRRSGNVWETPGYASAQAQITLSAEANAGSINLNPPEGCRD